MAVLDKFADVLPTNGLSNHTGHNAAPKDSSDKTRLAKTVWIDLENSPHVPFFRPIVQELEHRGYSVELTARDCFQVCELADMFNFRYRRIGHHYGKNRLAKLLGLGIRTLQMMPYVMRKRPDLALSHGSRSQCTVARLLRIPSIAMFDYEHARWIRLFAPRWVMAPEIIPEDSVRNAGSGDGGILRYPGIKEDVYAPFFVPDPLMKKTLGLKGNEIVATIRPPASEAHYHNPESEKLLAAVFEMISKTPNVKAFLLPRTRAQELQLKKQWRTLFQEGKVEVLSHVVNGLDLIWTSDLVISGGGTMNREAAALGVAVYSIFRGKTGAIDQYLSDTGRLTLLRTVDDVRSKISFVRRRKESRLQTNGRSALDAVVDNIVSVLESN
jgi:uncharacterized protein